MKAFVVREPMARVVRSALIALGSCSVFLLTSRAALANTGDTVAVLELAAPTSTEFILRGTIPVPPHIYPRTDGKTPFGIKSWGGEVMPAQCEHVSFYPRESDGSDVVEVLARVQRNPAVAPGTMIQFEIVELPHFDHRPRLTAPVEAMRTTPWSMELRTRDCYGNLYRADVRSGKYGDRVERFGEQVIQKRKYSVLEPVTPTTGPTATLPHMMGVHSYLSYWAHENVITLDLRIHNAASGLDKSAQVRFDDAQHKMYFDKLELVVPQGWTVLQDFEDPMFGPPALNGTRVYCPLVRPDPTGKLHVIGEQAQMERRIALCQPGNEARAREFLEQTYLGFCKKGTSSTGQPYWSWWNAQTARYFPQRYVMPVMGQLTPSSLRSYWQGELDHYEDALSGGISFGQHPIHFPFLGWAHPWGVQYGGMTSGSEIYLYDGHGVALSSSNAGYRFLELRHRMYTDRMPDALFNKDGDPTSMWDWVVQGPSFDYVPSMFFQTLITGFDMFGFDVATNQQVNFVAQQNLKPAYEDDLLAFMPIDLAHLARYLNAPKVLSWLGNDAMAKDDLLMQAEIARLSYHHLPNTAGGTPIVSGMLAQMDFVAAHPQIGFNFGRGNGWTVDAMCAAYSLGTSGWRSQARDWFDRTTLLVGQGQASCSGVIQAQQSSKFLNNLFRARQSIEQAIVENALWSMRESVYRNVDAARMADLGGTLERSCYSMVYFPGWSSVDNAPWSIAAVGPVNINLPLFCNTLPTGGHDTTTDSFQTWSSFAYGYELTGDPIFIERAMDMASPNFPDFYSAMHFGYISSNLENRYAAMSLSEHVTYP